MSEHLSSEEEDLLQSALSSAFTPASLPRQSAVPLSAPEPASQTVPAPEPTPQAQADTVAQPESAENVWKEEYEAHVTEWRRRSAEQRQKAEETRAEWEAIREQERKEGKLRHSVLTESAHSTSGWEQVSAGSAAASVAAPPESPSPADVRDLVSAEAEGGHSKDQSESVLARAPRSRTSTSTPLDHEPEPENEHEPPPSQPASEPESKQDKWDSMTSSMTTSSFPSMSFPSDPHSPISSAPRTLPSQRAHSGHPHASSHLHAHGHGHDHHHHPHHPPEEQRTPTLSVFDPTLSTKTRALALLSSVAINVLLPFVNGVMLGFGEIFAKNVIVQWLGWKVPGTASAGSSRGSGRTVFGRK